MRILRAKLGNYRGTSHREIEFAPGVTIVEGPNEVGKSSIVEALHLLFDFKDTSKAKDVRETFPAGRDENPQVEFEIESGPYRFTYMKQFGKGSKTELEVSQPKPESLAGDAAHERANRILADTLDVDLWKALYVHQGVGIQQANLGDNAALGRALDHASGSTSSSIEEGLLFKLVQNEHDLYFTPKGKRKSALDDGKKKIADLEESLEELEKREKSLQSDAKEHARLTKRLRDLEGQVPELEKDFSDRMQAWDAVKDLEQKAQREDSEAGRLKLEASQLEQRKTAREELAGKLSESKGREKDLLGKQDSVRGPLKKLREELKAAKKDLENARNKAEEAEALHKLRAQDSAYFRTKIDTKLLEERHERVVDIQRKELRANTVLETNQVTDKELASIIDADIEVRSQRRRLEEAGPQISALPLNDVSILVDGEKVDLKQGAAYARPIARTTTITIPDQLELTMTPGASAEDLKEALQTAVRTWDALLENHSLDSVKAARSANRERNQAQQDLGQTDLRLQENLRDLTFKELEAKRDACREFIKKHVATRAEKPLMSDKLATAREFEEDAKIKLTEAGKRARDAADHVSDFGERITRQSNRDTRLDAQIEAGREAASGWEDELQSERQELSDDDLRAKIRSAKSKATAAEESAKSLCSQLESENLSQVEARKDSAEATLDSANKERRELRESLREVQGRLEAKGEEGLFEKMEVKRSSLYQAQNSQSRLESRANAALLLHTTLSAYRDEAQRRYEKPLISYIETLGRMVFNPSFRVTLKPDLSIESRTLDKQTVPFKSLSGGTKEQLGLLTLLAVATIVSEDEGVPLFLDDTLVHSDPERLETMAATIAQTADCCQVVILTCAPDRFRGIPGAQMRRLTPGG